LPVIRRFLVLRAAIPAFLTESTPEMTSLIVVPPTVALGTAQHGDVVCEASVFERSLYGWVFPDVVDEFSHKKIEKVGLKFETPSYRTHCNWMKRGQEEEKARKQQPGKVQRRAKPPAWATETNLKLHRLYGALRSNPRLVFH
jgi:hypothetical protein